MGEWPLASREGAWDEPADLQLSGHPRCLYRAEAECRVTEGYPALRVSVETSRAQALVERRRDEREPQPYGVRPRLPLERLAGLFRER